MAGFSRRFTGREVQPVPDRIAQLPEDMHAKEPLATEVLVEGQIEIVGPQHFTPGFIGTPCQTF